jgi:hypothetical protein
VQDAASLISASSQSGNDGTITSNTARTALGSSVLALPMVQPARAPELAANVCARDSGHSTFVIGGGGGVAPGPDGYLIGRVGTLSTGDLAAINGVGLLRTPLSMLAATPAPCQWTLGGFDSH